MSVVDHMPYDQVYGEVRRNARRDANQQAMADLFAGIGQGISNYAVGRRQIAQDTERKAERDREFALRQRSQDREDQQYQADQSLNASMMEDQQPGQFLYGLQGAPRGPETFGPPAPTDNAAESFGPPSPDTQPAPVASRGVPDAYGRASPGAQARYNQNQKQVLSAQEAVKALTPVLQHAVNEQVVDQPTAGAILAHVRQNPADLDNALNNLQQRRTASIKGKADEDHRTQTLASITPNANRVAQLSPKHAGEVAMLLDEYSHGQIKASEVNRRLADIEDQAAYGPEQAAQDIQTVNPEATPETAGAAARLRSGKYPVGIGDANFAGKTRENIKSTPRYIKAESQVRRAQRQYDEANSEYQAVTKDTMGFKNLNESQKLARFEAKKARNDARTKLEKAEAAFDSLLTDQTSTPGAPSPVSGAPGAPDNLDAVLDSLSPDELLKLLKGS